MTLNLAKVFTTFILAVGLTIGLSASSPPPTLAAQYSAVSLITAPDDTSGERYCSGAVVELPQGPRVVTAGHCVGNVGDRVYLRTIAGRFYTATVESAEFDWPQDYAVLGSVAQYLLPALEVGGDMVIGDTYSSWSSPHGYELLFFTGIYSGIIMPNEVDRNDTLDSTGMPFLTIDGAGGSSGSIILNSQGRAVAILAGGLATVLTPENSVVRIPLRGVMLAPLPGHSFQ